MLGAPDAGSGLRLGEDRSARQARRRARRPEVAAAQRDGRGVGPVRAARDQQRGDPGRHDRDAHRGHSGRRPRMPPDLVPPSRPGRDDRFRESRPAERARAMRHARPVGASGRRVVRAGLQHPLAQAVGRTDLRPSRHPGAGRAASAASPAARAGAGIRAARPRAARSRAGPDRGAPELGGGDDKGVRHGVGGFTRRVRVGQHEPAVGVQRRRVTVIRLGEPVRVTDDDGRDQLTVLHGPNRSCPRIAASRKDITR